MEPVGQWAPNQWLSSIILMEATESQTKRITAVEQVAYVLLAQALLASKKV